MNSIELAEEPSERASILEEIGQALRRTAEKRDAVAGFLGIARCSSGLRMPRSSGFKNARRRSHDCRKNSNPTWFK